MTSPDRPSELDPDALADATRRVVDAALAEDLAEAGDLTTAATVPADAAGTADVVARSGGVLAGLAAAETVFTRVDPGLTVTWSAGDGQRVAPGQVVGSVSGALRSLLTAERTALNLLGHLSGVATATAAFVEAVAGTGCVVRDTRKTLPGLRLLQKAAVVAGGGVSHRLGLHDALLVKDNHVAAAGGIAAATRAALAAAAGKPVQVEAASFEELSDALDAGATDVLLDNFDPEEVAEAVRRAAGRATLEASGTITVDTVRDYAEAGAERVAVGAITHSAPQLDIALDVRTAPVGGGR